MTHFSYHLSGLGREETLAGGATDEIAARREAFAFASDLLKDIAAGSGAGSPFTVELRIGREVLCRITVDLDPCDA